MIGSDRFRSFRIAVEEYFRQHSEDTVSIDSEVSIEFETTEISINRSPHAVLFEKIKGFKDYRLVTNLLGTENRILYFTGSDSREAFLSKWTKAIGPDTPYDPEYTSNPNFLKNIFCEGDIDLFSLPAPVHYVNDGSKLSKGRYITSALVVSRNPDDPSTHNLGFSRIQLLEKNKFAFDAGSRGHTWGNIQRAMRDGNHVDLTFVIGVHPILYLLGASFIENEYRRSGVFLDTFLYRGYRNDISVPADAEIVIEASMDFSERADEGPFAEYTGYMGYDTTGYVAHARSLLVRDHPVYYDILPSNSDEHLNIFSFPRSLSISRDLVERLPGGSDVKIEWPSYASRFLAIGYVKSKAGDLRLQAACGIISSDPLWAKFVFMFDRESDLSLFGVFASLAASSQKGFTNVLMLPESFIISSDIGSGGKMSSSRMIALLDTVEYSVEHGNDLVVIKSGGKRCTISYEPPGNSDLEIMMPSDIDIHDQKKVGWALSTRVNPARDISIARNRMTISALSGHPEVPVLPRNPGDAGKMQ